MYADDTQIYTSTTFNELPNTLKEINSITTKLENYFNYNYLKLNLQKTECIIFHSKSHTPPPITHIKIANKDIPIKTTITTLDVILESDLTFDKHISLITKQCNYKIFKIKQIKHLLNQTSLKILTSAYILSKLDYCNSLLINIPKIQEKRLNKIINHTCRLIYKLPKRTHITLYRKKLKFLTFKHRSIYKILTIIHTALKTDIPKYMSDSIKLKLKSNLRSSSKKLLKQDITNNFPQLWNKLPITVTNENNTNTFKSKLHKYLLGLDWYNLTHPYNIPTATELSNRFTL